MHLEYLSLAHNEIEKIEGLTTLKKLLFLDLSENLIAELDTDELPASIAILKVRENPIADSPNTRTALILALPELEDLDGEAISMVTRFEARGVP